MKFIKWFFIIVVCPVVALFLAIDSGVVDKNKQNDVFRIDLGGEKQTQNIQIVSSDMTFNKPTWCKDCLSGTGHFNMTEDGRVTIKFKAVNDDKVSIRLMGPNVMNNDVRIPVLVTYKNLVVDNQSAFDGNVRTYHDNPHVTPIQMSAGQVVEFSVLPQKTSLIYLVRHMHVDFYKFVLFLFVLFIMYRIFDKFVNKNNGLSYKFDAIFVCVFVVLLFIPMLRISDAEKSDQENRTLAAKPSLMINDKINNKYGTEFDSWFSDRFNGREMVTSAYKLLKYKLSSQLVVSGSYVNKKNKWIVPTYTSNTMFNQTELDLMSKNIDKLQAFADKNNMKFYIVIAPQKNLMYGSEFLPWYNGEIEQQKRLQAISWIKEHNGVDIIYPYEELVELKKHDMVFFKTDHHWTDAAAFVAYQQLMTQVKKDFPNIRVMKDTDFDYFYSNKVRVVQNRGLHNGSQYGMLGVDDETFFDTKYKYFDAKEKSKLKVDIKTYGEKNYIVRHYAFDGNNRYNLTLFGDSFGENMEAIIPYSFKNTLRLYTWVPTPETSDLKSKNLNIQRFESDILKNKTNVLVVVFFDIGRLMYLYKD